MKILCISDPHGKLPDLSGYEYDLILLAGDVCPHHNHPAVRAKSYEDAVFQFEWVRKKLIPWINSQKSKVVMIAGNHDACFQHLDFYGDPERFRAECKNVVYLLNDWAIVNGLKVWGSPYSLFFFDWSFNLPKDPDHSNEAEHALYSQIPEDVDIVMTHGPMYNVLDLVKETVVYNTLQGEVVCDRETYTGSRILKEYLFKLPKLKAHICGHIHQSYGRVDGLGTAKFAAINACIVNENYKLTPEQPPIIYVLET